MGTVKILDEMLVAVTGSAADGTANVPCDKLPPLVLTIDGTKYTMPVDRFATGGTNFCDLSITSENDGWRVGPTFLQEYCLVVDQDNKRLGLSQNLVPMPPKKPE